MFGQQQKQPSAAEQIQALNQALTSAFIKKHEAEGTVADSDKTITAIRNLLAGVQMGQKLQDEVLAEKAAMAAVVNKAAEVPPVILND